jgi:Protein of unknown function (DUF3301)
VDFLSLLLLLLTGAAIWFWTSSIRSREIAREAARLACLEMDVQFLDDTVASTHVAPARDASGRRVLRRTYRFEFSETGNSRRQGKVITLGHRVERVAMEPYQIM